ncbi:hypothetical protein RSAG8_13378, partial [Rhizoctonia solani AG-8 WAC10335]
MGWEPLPMLLYGFAIHPLSASLSLHDRVSAIGPPRIELDAIPEHAHRNPHLAHETASGLVEPLVDEIASALREWHARLFTYLAKRDYRTFTSVREHIDALHLGRRQLLLGGMSSEEAAALRRECVMRLVRGNVAQGLDVLVRHPAGGGLVGVEIDFGQGKKADVGNWVSTIRMYAMQCALAYIDAQAHSYKPSALGPVQDLFFPPPLTDPNQPRKETSRPKFHHILPDLRGE